RESTFLAAVCARGESVGAAFLDISTGEFRATQASGSASWERIAADLESYAPRELLFPESLAPLIRAGLDSLPRTEPLPLASSRNPTVREGAESASADFREERPQAPSLTVGFLPGTTLTPLDDWLWQFDDSESLLIKHLAVRSLDG